MAIPKPLKLLFDKSSDSSDISVLDEVGVGTIRWDRYGRAYRWMKNMDTTAFVAKQPVAFDGTNNGGTESYFEKATRVVTAELMNAAGLSVAAIAASGSTNKCHGWVACYGHFTDAVVVTPATGGNDIEIGSELISVNVAVHLAYGGNAGTAPAYSNHFTSLEVLATATGAATTTLDVMIKCL